jgi:transposase-like protein
MNKPVIESKKVRKKFDRAFNERAVELWLNRGRAATEVAAELGFHAQRLSAWRRRFAPHNGKPKTPAYGARSTISANSATF